MRYVFAVVGLLLVIGGLVAIKYTQISTLIGFGKKMEQSGPPPEVVGSSTSDTRTWEATVSAVGTVASVKGVSISNDAPGVVSKILFESGARVKQGDILVELDTSVERAQVASALVQKDLANRTSARSRSLAASGILTQAQLESDESQLRSRDADIALLQAQINRKIVRAPFAGRLGIRNVNIGQYLNPGTPLTVLESVEGAYVDFTLPQQQKVEKGMAVHLTVDGAPDLTSDGSIVAIDPTIDAASRTTKLRASVGNKDDKLHPGMFVNVSVTLPTSSKVVVVPATAIVHASYGDSIFVVEAPAEDAKVDDSSGEAPRVAMQHFIRIGEKRGDFVSVLDGLSSGQEVVSAGAFKLHNKGRIVINNDKAPTPLESPQPENH